MGAGSQDWWVLFPALGGKKSLVVRAGAWAAGCLGSAPTSRRERGIMARARDEAPGSMGSNFSSATDVQCDPGPVPSHLYALLLSRDPATTSHRLFPQAGGAFTNAV